MKYGKAANSVNGAGARIFLPAISLTDPINLISFEKKSILRIISTDRSGDQ
jgi:hypothetical protein